jgi:hypothetical protein
LAEILISRYEQFIENNSVTHIITNLSASELENPYGNRVRSRLRQMFNLIAFHTETIDKRDNMECKNILKRIMFVIIIFSSNNNCSIRKFRSSCADKLINSIISNWKEELLK